VWAARESKWWPVEVDEETSEMRMRTRDSERPRVRFLF
jgi:hypothetical protein